MLVADAIAVAVRFAHVGGASGRGSRAEFRHITGIRRGAALDGVRREDVGGARGARAGAAFGDVADARRRAAHRAGDDESTRCRAATARRPVRGASVAGLAGVWDPVVAGRREPEDAATNSRGG